MNFIELFTIRSELQNGIDLANIPLRVVIYARVSTDHLEQKNSLNNQLEYFKDYIEKNHNWIYITSYIDEGITGTNDTKREQFMKMISDSKSDKFDLIITKEISRFSRNTLDSIKYTRELLNNGVAVFFVNDNINTVLPDSELRLTIMASLAQDEVRRLSERVRFGMNRAIEKKVILGNNLLYGYKKDKESKKLVIVEEEARVLESIYRKYAIDKLSISKIVKELNSKNIKTSMGNKFSISTVSRMIANPKYKGYYCGRKTRVVDYMTKKVKYLTEDEWYLCKDIDSIPPIVTEQLWLLANNRLSKRKKQYKKTTNNKELYLYSNKIYCSNDKNLFYRRYFKKDKSDATWVCSNYLKNGKRVCDSANIRESELDYIFDKIVEKLNVTKKSIIDVLINYYKKNNKEKDNNLEIEKITTKKNKLLDLYLDKLISKEEYIVRISDYNEMIKTIEDNNKECNNLDDIINLLNKSITTTEVRKIVVPIILNKILITKRKDIVLLHIYLFIKNNDFVNRVEFEREKNTITYLIKYYYTT